MIARRVLFCMLVVPFVLAGCSAPPQDKPRARGVSPADFAAIRDRVQRVSPDVLVGQVIAVDASARLAAVAEMPVEKIGPGDVITFTDARQEPICSGTVTRVSGNRVFVEYPKDAAHPAAGDLAFRFLR